MVNEKQLFSELNGFIIYEPKSLKKYLETNNLKDKNVLKYFIETNHGNNITENGIAIPMTDIDTEYYNFSLVKNINEKIISEEKINSKGWILKIISKEINIIGMGYFCDIDSINENNKINFSVENGWYEIEIIGGIIENKLYYELILNKTETKPKYYGNINFSYKIL